MKSNNNFCLFSMILKNSQVAFIHESKLFFCSVANVELADFSQIFFGDS